MLVVLGENVDNINSKASFVGWQLSMPEALANAQLRKLTRHVEFFRPQTGEVLRHFV